MSDPRYAPWPEHELELTGGAWRLDPFDRIVRWVPGDPTLETPDAFDDPLVPGLESEYQIPHGTTAGYAGHYRHKVPVCGPCRRANKEAVDKAKARRVASGDPRWSCECGAYKDRGSQRCRECAHALRWGRDAA